MKGIIQPKVQNASAAGCRMTLFETTGEVCVQIPMSASHHFLVYLDAVPSSVSLVINDGQSICPPHVKGSNVLYIPPFQATTLDQNPESPWLLLQLSDGAFLKHLEQGLECEGTELFVQHREICLGDRSAVRGLFECVSADTSKGQIGHSLSKFINVCLNGETEPKLNSGDVGGSPDVDQYDPYFREKKIRGYMWHHVEQSISLDQLAGLVFQSKYHFLRWFKSLTGHSPMNYLRMLRVFKARCLMHTQGDVSTLVSIANDCGFSDQAHFTRMFKKHTGMTPSAYQKQKNSACADVLASLRKPSSSS